MAKRRTGKPYIHVTWLSKLLGGDQCQWSAWFKAHHKYQKFEAQAVDLVQWSRDHNELMRRRRAELERAGWTVTVEQENDFKLEGETAIIAGKPDIVATRPGIDGGPPLALVVDGKTGKERESDIWQVLIYLYALPKVRKDLADHLLEGEVHYKRGDQRLTITPEELTPERMDLLVSLIKTVAGELEPPRIPTYYECLRCNIGRADCPARQEESRRTVAVADF